jgi:hypothetical protein
MSGTVLAVGSSILSTGVVLVAETDTGITRGSLCTEFLRSLNRLPKNDLLLAGSGAVRAWAFGQTNEKGGKE